MYDFVCDVCGETMELIVPYEMRNKAKPHKQESDTNCLGILRRDGISGFAVAGSASLDGRHQTKAIMYDGERKVGYVDGHFGKSARRKRK
jgi:hypothetical protein